MKPKIFLIFILAILSYQSFAVPNLSEISRCNWGYNHTSSIISKESQDEFFPKEITPWELCKLALEPEPNHFGYAWVVEALRFLEAPSSQLRPLEMLTKRGQCEIGSILSQKRYSNAHDNVAISLIAKGICKNIPKTLL